MTHEARQEEGMAGDIWIVAEHAGGKPKKVTLELIAKARELAGDSKVVAVVLGSSVGPIGEEIAGYPVDDVVVGEDETLSDYTAEGYLAALKKLADERAPDAIFIAATATGKDLAPRLAAALGTGLASDCIDVEKDDGGLVFVRPVYAGKALTKVTFPEARPQIASIRPKMVAPAESTGDKAQVTSFEPGVDASAIRAKVKEVVRASGDFVDVTEAEFVVSGGRGVKDPKNFALLEKLAKVLGGSVGASRAAVDADWIDHAHQVGQTGKAVAPQLYVACGISGAIQHLVGMTSSKCIVAINKNPDADIFKAADYGIVGDLFEVLPILTEELKKELAD
jgi:electron transfer flavoprotein alpha subunit